MELIPGIVDFLQSIWDWLYSGIYDFVASAFVLLTKMLIHAWLSAKLFLLKISYTAFSEIVSEIGITDKVSEYYGYISPETRAILSALRIPEALLIICSAIGTRWTMNFVPFLGR